MNEFIKKQSKLLIILLSALVAFGPLSIDMYLPALPSIAYDLNSTVASTQKTITIFLLGFSIGMLIYGPLSDRFGRKKLLLIGMVLYVFATLGCIFSQHIEQLLLFRFLQAMGGASASVLARALVRDLFNNQEIPKILSLMHIITMIATLVAPLAGAIIIQYFNWTGIFIFLFIYSLLCMVWVNFQIDAPPPRRIQMSLIDNYLSVLKNRYAWGFILCNSFSFGGMFAYITASSFVFIHYYGFSPQQYSGLFALNIFSIIIFTSINSRALRRYTAFQLLKIMSIISAIAGLYLATITLFKLTSVQFLIPGLMIFVGVTGAIGANSIANLLKLLPQQAGTASGLAVSLQFLMGALLSYIVSLLFRNNDPTAMNLVICIAGLLCSISLYLFCRGYKEHSLDAQYTELKR
ncbi:MULTISPECIES: Bcr/CflA family multidrug efflux MFS transporter [unclassified Acinetobacter]|uniref:Bcr/CflA family multidrug efflux MFS transporter n=1 Tax=unclassified Acinetobacter TaxID=196816 RepID=UPI0025791409|nr:MULTISPECIES: Bcr/CflA family multidrug efflux MFS transporter [unclassified Acinetobacter]MDM1759159.1 Bcr/CflA family multidrug efflux MFS transporter [Acinetobacter sp. 256-1]MDM1760226.1 Bcr/CflA family multidrug efflux MFS transporter [Acinetobacter sp. 251-1]